MKTTYIPALATLLLLAAPVHAFDASAVPTEVIVKKQGDGWLFTSAKGMTLYTYDNDVDHPGESVCKAPPPAPKTDAPADNAYQNRRPAPNCARAWPAVAAPADAVAHGEWSVIARDDGTKQWAYQGRPLYTYARDGYPGAIVGEGVQRVWHVAFQPIDMPQQITMNTAVTGRVLSDVRGMTLYTHEGETASGKSKCTGSCTDTWMPAAAPWAANATGDWAVVTREDGSKQWAYQNKPLYSYARDVKPGDITGNGVEGWSALLLEPQAPTPAWVTMRHTDLGDVLGDAKGLTVYSFIGNMDNVKRITCNDACFEQYLRPMVAPADTKPLGNWSVVKQKDGTAQWAYMGNLLYTHTLDKKPGDVQGDRWASGDGHNPGAGAGGWFRPIMVSCMCSVGATQGVSGFETSLVAPHMPQYNK